MCGVCAYVCVCVFLCVCMHVCVPACLSLCSVVTTCMMVSDPCGCILRVSSEEHHMLHLPSLLLQR